MKTYISGQISGLHPDLVKDIFEQAEAQLLSFGHEPVSPLKNGLPEDATYKEHLSKDIYLLLQCKAIYLLANWRESKGARVEKKVAEEYGLKIIEQPDVAIHPSIKDKKKKQIFPPALADLWKASTMRFGCDLASRPNSIIVDDVDED